MFADGLISAGPGNLRPPATSDLSAVGSAHVPVDGLGIVGPADATTSGALRSEYP